jgi:hypothetical protein
VDAVADDRDAELLQDVEPVLERAGPVGQPGIVLDAELHVPRCRRRRGERAQRGCERGDDGETPHPGEATRRYPMKRQGFR